MAHNPFESMTEDFWLDSQEKLQRVEAILLRYAMAAAEERVSLFEKLKLLLHTLKGNSAMMGFEELRASAHEIEDALKAANPIELDVASILLSIDAFTAQLRSRCRADSSQDSDELSGEDSESSSSGSLHDAVRIPSTQLDSLVDLVSELILARNRLADSILNGTRTAAADAVQGGKSKSAWREVKLIFDSLCATLDEAQRNILNLRMVPLGSVFNPLNRIVFEESRVESKNVVLETAGGETQFDKALLDVASEALGHLVRNAVVHGIETPSERKRSGKPGQATVRVVATQGPDEVIIEVSDDGRGIDEQQLRDAARDRGIDVSTLEDIQSLLFVSGFSTKQEADRSSGRGVGLSAVAESVRLQGGHVETRSTLGEGTTFRLTLPLNVSIVPALLLEADGEQYALALEAVLDSQRLVKAKANRVNNVAVTQWRGRTLPFVDIGVHLGTRADVREDGYLVVVESHGQRRGVLVDKIHGIQEFVVKGLDPIVGEPEGISGCTVLGDGRAILILDPAALVRLALFAEASS